MLRSPSRINLIVRDVGQHLPSPPPLSPVDAMGLRPSLSFFQFTGGVSYRAARMTCAPPPLPLASMLFAQQRVSHFPLYVSRQTLRTPPIVGSAVFKLPDYRVEGLLLPGSYVRSFSDDGG